MDAQVKSGGRLQSGDGPERGSSRYCCTSVPALGFWLGVFAMLWGAVMLLQLVTPALRPYTSALLFAAAGVACLTNFRRNRTLHCALTGPFFLLIAGALALAESGLWATSLAWVWPAVLIGVGLALLVEWRCTSRA